MRKTLAYLGAILLLALSFGCHKKQPSTDIITSKPVKRVENKVLKVGDYNQSMNVDWLGKSYQIEVSRQADSSLPIVKDDGGNKYYDNKISLKVLREDGSEFFSHTFTKKDFSGFIDETYKEHNVLLGIVFDDCKEGSLCFAASVGAPDMTSDEYIPFIITLSKSGQMSISRDTRLDM